MGRALTKIGHLFPDLRAGETVTVTRFGIATVFFLHTAILFERAQEFRYRFQFGFEISPEREVMNLHVFKMQTLLFFLG